MNMTDIENDKESYKILLIDIDNCPSEIEKIMNNPNDYTKIIICYGGQIPKIPLNLIN